MNSYISQEVTRSRGKRNLLRPDRPYALLTEEEWLNPRIKKSISTVFLTNKECPWRCVMCDLWKNTLPYSNSDQDIISQVTFALDKLEPTDWIKLYNSGSFFDQKAINKSSWPALLPHLNTFERIIVENHPKLTQPEVLHFRSGLPGEFEIAMGLESANEEILKRLNKGFDLSDFRRACEKLHEWDVLIRAFVLINPPFTRNAKESLKDIEKSCLLCNECGVQTLSLIPTRGDSEYMKILEKDDQFQEPNLELIDKAFQVGLNYFSGRTLLDLWDISKFATCKLCIPNQVKRFSEMNRLQVFQEPLSCASCNNSNFTF